jgi:hypothetical protein
VVTHHAAGRSENLSAGDHSHGRESKSFPGVIGELERLIPEARRNDVEKFLAAFGIRQSKSLGKDLTQASVTRNNSRAREWPGQSRS